MVECSDWKLELICVSNEGFQIRNSVAMSIDHDLSSQNGGQRLPPQILRQIGSHLLRTNGVCSGTPVILAISEGSSLLKGMAEVPGFSKATERSEVPASLAIHILGILTARHFYVPMVSFWIGKKALNAQLWSAIGLADCMLDHKSFATNVVSAARKN